MPQSRQRKGHQERVQKRNQKRNQIMSENQQKSEVFPVPYWSSKDEFSITGQELDLIYNYLTSVQPALAAATAIMNRGIMSGKIKMKWQKQNEDGSTTDATDEESKVQKEEFETMIATLKAGQLPEVKTQLDEPNLTVVE